MGLIEGGMCWPHPRGVNRTWWFFFIWKEWSASFLPTDLSQGRAQFGDCRKPETLLSSPAWALAMGLEHRSPSGLSVLVYE